MSLNLENTALNDILCFLSTSRDSSQYDDAVTTAHAFYSSDAVKIAKENIFQISKEKPINRRSCKETPDPTVADIRDILDLFEKNEGKRIVLPKFVAHNHTSLPPASGFLMFARIMVDLRDEISALRTEISQIREEKESNIKTLEDAIDIKQDISDIKNMLLTMKIPDQIVNRPQNNVEEITNDPAMSYADAFKLKPGPFIGERARRGHSVDNRNPRYHSNNVVAATGVTGELAGAARRLIRRELIIGTAQNGSENDLCGAPKVLDIYVGGCQLSTDPDKVKSYCTKKLKMSFIKCCQLESKSKWNKSFKISIHANVRDELLKPEFWPEGIVIRKFFNPRNKTLINVTESRANNTSLD